MMTGMQGSSSSSSSGEFVLEPQAEAFQLLSTSVVATPTDSRQKCGGWAYSNGPHMFLNVHQSQRHDSTHPRLYNQVGYHSYICGAPANWQH